LSLTTVLVAALAAAVLMMLVGAVPDILGTWLSCVRPETEPRDLDPPAYGGFGDRSIAIRARRR
jgi:hypothetical protein